MPWRRTRAVSKYCPSLTQAPHLFRFFSPDFQFQAQPTFCLGELVVAGQVMQWSGDGNPLFAVTANRTTVIGPLTQGDVAALGVTFGVSGFGTIVENGRASPAGESRIGCNTCATSRRRTRQTFLLNDRHRARPHSHPCRAAPLRGDRPAHGGSPRRSGCVWERRRMSPQQPYSSLLTLPCPARPPPPRRHRRRGAAEAGPHPGRARRGLRPGARGRQRPPRGC